MTVFVDDCRPHCLA